MIQKESLHKGVVKEISEGFLTVNITAESACLSCHERGACQLSEMQVKEIEISDYTGDFHIGQDVNVLVKTSHGFKALFFGYIFPLFFVLLVMIVTSAVTDNDGIIGGLSLMVLIPYYLALYSFKEKIKRAIEFRIEPVVP